jgi:hypothetical protein
MERPLTPRPPLPCAGEGESRRYLRDTPGDPLEGGRRHRSGRARWPDHGESGPRGSEAHDTHTHAGSHLARRRTRAATRGSGRRSRRPAEPRHTGSRRRTDRWRADAEIVVRRSVVRAGPPTAVVRSAWLDAEDHERPRAARSHEPRAFDPHSQPSPPIPGIPHPPPPSHPRARGPSATRDPRVMRGRGEPISHAELSHLRWLATCARER